MRRVLTPIFLAAIVLTTLIQLVPRARTEQAIDDELALLERDLARIDTAALPKELLPFTESAKKLIDSARGAKAPVVKLVRLREAFVAVHTIAYYGENQAAGETLEALTARIGERRRSFVFTNATPRGSLLQVALIQAAENRAEKLLDASVAYGKAASSRSGLYYLAEAEANRAFAQRVRAVPFDLDMAAAPRAASVSAALDRAEDQLLALFGSDASGKAAIAPSAKLKEARELANRGRIEGAALTLLEARLAMATRQPARGEGTRSAPVRTDSIVALWSARTSEEPQHAAVIEQQVLPLYASLFYDAAAESRTPAVVTVTLVRWPYT